MKHTAFEQQRLKNPLFFLGANSGKGFYNLFSEVFKPDRQERLYIIKGGPGTGKSTFMKRLALDMEQEGILGEFFFCSSDPQSLDGVRFPDIGVALIDGTAPHVVEPVHLGIHERVIHLDECLNCDLLEANRAALLSLYQQNKEFHKRAVRFIAAAAQLRDDSFAVDCDCSDLEAAELAAKRLVSSCFTAKTQQIGDETRYFLSGITPDGLMIYDETLTRLADKIYGIEDEYGGVSSVMMSVIRRECSQAGHDIIVCPSPLSPERTIDHVIIPKLRVAFCTVNSLFPITTDTERRVHTRRFRNMEKLSQKKQRLRFNQRACEELLDGACHYISQAREIHDQLESYYIKSMDFSKLETKYQHIYLQLKQRIKN